MARPGGTGPIRLRLALAFVAVALAAVGLITILTAFFAAADVSHLAGRQQRDLTQAMAVAAGATWDRTETWAGADLMPVTDMGTRIGADVEITDNAGRTMVASPGYSLATGPMLSSPIVVRGQHVGTLTARFTGAGFAAADNALRTALWWAIIGAAGVAALLALLVGLAVARRITRPVTRLIEVVRAMGHGDRAARVGDIRAPDELRELAGTFDWMAGSLARQEQLRRDLVADVAHELRTPVAVLQAGHEALLDGVVEPTPGQLSSLRDEVLRLARMVDDLHTLAAAEAAALHLSRVPCDLAKIAAEAADSMAAQFDTAGLTLERQLAPVTVLADAARLRQIIMNLLGNSLKFTPPGGRVTLGAGPAGARAELRVADTGSGISAAELPLIFDRFWRGEAAAGVTGSGIGLAIVAELVRAHDGLIDVTSTPGRGTEVLVSLPAADD
ncbi:MAG TPA: ATP-binding protein [Streptosporangiaceae bacterium]|jgi:two-component system sensor histidine kinase BaeS